MKPKQYLPGLLALVTALLLLVGLMLLLEAGKPVPDDPPPLTQPPIPANPYGPEDFVFDDAGALISGPGCLGIDVSSHQEAVDWTAVREAGMEFVFIRVGYRGYTQGGLQPDPKAREFYEGATAAGLKVGVYFFSQAISVAEAQQEAAFLLEAIQGWQLEMPLVYDWEFVSSEARTAHMDRRTLTDCTIAFCQTVAQAGYTPMIYFNASQARDLLYLEELTEWPWWLARYSTELDFPYAVDIWQYSNRGTVPGIEGDVDLNIWLDRDLQPFPDPA